MAINTSRSWDHDCAARPNEQEPDRMTDWFERLTGFREDGYESTRRRLAVEGDELVSTVNGKALRHRQAEPADAGRASPAREPSGTAQFGARADRRCARCTPTRSSPAHCSRSRHSSTCWRCRRSTSPGTGVAGYAGDHTQGPACAMAAGAATIYRNYFIARRGRIGQTAERQLNAP